MAQASWRPGRQLFATAKVLPMAASGFYQNTAEETLAAIISSTQ